LNRRNRAGLKRIGLLALALVIALGALGVGYAAWIDTIEIQGTAYTGTLDIDVSDCSSTFVYKVPPDGIVVNYDSGSEDQNAPPDGELIASAVATFDNGPSDADTATITFNGLFPEIDFRADLQIESLGTIPVKVSIAEIIPDNDPGPDKAEKDAILAELWEMGKETKDDPTRYGAWIEGELYPFSGDPPVQIDDPIGLQLHQFDMVHITMHVRLPQEEAYQNLSGLKFTGLITVIQWNMYGVEE
jgi:hypothetical protein